MVQHLWFIYALSTAVLWGLGYPLLEKLLRAGFSPAFLILTQTLLCLPFYFLAMHLLGNFKSELNTLFGNPKLLLMLVVVAATLIGGQFLIFSAVNEKNATLTSLIEMSYPLFVFLFSWVLFKEAQLTWFTGLGGLLIFSGITLIYIKG